MLFKGNFSESFTDLGSIINKDLEGTLDKIKDNFSIDENKSIAGLSKEIRIPDMKDDFGNIYFKDGKLLPNSSYTLNDYKYKTDDQGRITGCEGQIKLSPDNGRDLASQVLAGGEDRFPTDDGGHIIGRTMGGDPGAGNMVSMDSRINRSDYKRMENQMSDSAESGKNVEFSGSLQYQENSQRPQSMEVELSVDGDKTKYHFDNSKGEYKLENEIAEKIDSGSKELLDDVLDETKGYISSYKEEFGHDNEPSRLVVTTTYKDEYGNYQRVEQVFDLKNKE